MTRFFFTGVLILVAILAIIMFLLLRIYLFKKPVPRPISNAYVSIMSKITRRNEEPVSTPNELYISDSDYEVPLNFIAFIF